MSMAVLSGLGAVKIRVSVSNFCWFLLEIPSTSSRPLMSRAVTMTT